MSSLLGWRWSPLRYQQQRLWKIIVIMALTAAYVAVATTTTTGGGVPMSSTTLASYRSGNSMIQSTTHLRVSMAPILDAPSARPSLGQIELLNVVRICL